MIFEAQNGFTRPIRLSEATRKFAYDSLHFRYGLDTKRVTAIEMDGHEGFGSLSMLSKYDAAIRAIAERAPIRICEGERISGAATLGLAISHFVPVTYEGKPLCCSISHLTVDFETVLKKGLHGIRLDVLDSIKLHRGSDRMPFLISCLSCLDSFAIWHGRYLDALLEKPGYEANLENLKKVPFLPATSFYEAVQSIWMTFAFLRLCGNWPGIGRIDRLLGSYLEHDLESGLLTVDEARDILAHFFIKGCEWICGGNYGSGDAQHYQNLVLSGMDESGNQVYNAVTDLVLDILEETGISDFPTTVRLSKRSDPKLIHRVAEGIRYGGGALAVYNEDLILDSLVKAGYAYDEAIHFANDGCWEVQIPGKTYFQYIPFDSLQILQRTTLCSYERELSFHSFEELYGAYCRDLKSKVDEICRGTLGLFAATPDQSGEWRWKEDVPCTVVSLFEQGCIEKGLSYREGGPRYLVISPHIGGLADTVNFLYAVKKLVFDEAKLTLNALLQILRANWEGHEDLRRYVMDRYAYYGNDSDEVDGIARQILSDFAGFCDANNGICPYRFPGGVSTFGRQLEWAPNRLACAHGRRAHTVLSGNCSPTPGTDKQGATAIIRSYCKNDLVRLPSGSALDIRLLPKGLEGERGTDVLSSLLTAFVHLGGFFMQPDVLDASILKKAQEDPESYRTLSVRISGWNARFVTLDRQWQDMVIAQYGG